MGRTIMLFTALFLGVFASSHTFAQEQPEQTHGPGFGGGRGAGFGGGRGQGFRGGRGPGFGQSRGMRHHTPANDKTEKSQNTTYPAIANHGGVVRLPNAAQQPRAWTKLLVDLTSGGDAEKLNSGITKVAKYVNIYAGGGTEPADVKIAVVFHGNATLTVLNDDAYAAKFNTEGNPNLKLLRQLHESGVEFYVCGQSLISKGATPDDVAVFIKTAVSALTAVVNLQADGFAYVPIAHASPASSHESQTMAAKNGSDSNEENHAHGRGKGRGMGMGRGPRNAQGRGVMQGMQGDMTTLHAMFANQDKIKRTVKNRPDGAEAVTESDDETIADMLKEHVPAMEDRVLGNKPLPPMTFHPIFVGLIKHANDYTLNYEETDKGMKVTYRSDDPYVVMLVQEHAKLVSRFIKNGMEEIHTPYELPKFPKETDADERKSD
ncbi:MAG: DsrE family protein [Planctomycetaceae bacterium]|nr:DsrE family protein [Planctomycetaceae bacterium]